MLTREQITQASKLAEKDRIDPPAWFKKAMALSNYGMENFKPLAQTITRETLKKLTKASKRRE